MKRTLFIFFLLISFTGIWALPYEPSLSESALKVEQQNILKKLGKRPALFDPWRCESVRSVILERVRLSSDKKILWLYCNVGLAQIAIRSELLQTWAGKVRETLGDDYQDCDVRFYAYNIPAERFIPNYFRDKADRDPKRESTPINGRPLVRRTDRPVYGQGLGGRHIALWGGHGKYYHEEVDSAWKWQRPALFTTIEDLNTQEFAARYLAPMLENAGAAVVMARERDPQPMEIIIDNDGSTGNAKIITSGKWKKESGGFAVQDTISKQNPFRQGTVLQSVITPDIKPAIIYIPTLDKPDKYGVYVSWKALPSNLTNARYTIVHAGGQAEFEVNQRIGGSMWVWLGAFDLDSASKIILSTPDNATSGTLTADAVKIGGGMGNIKRGEDISRVSRYAEAARYWMQYCGVPDSIYAQETLSPDNKDNKQLDYIDNFKGNGDWCNYIRKQKNIPLDLAVGLHTDAGICDSVVGTLTIHYTDGTKANYTNGKSKLAGRDLADLVQTQIINDLRAKYDTSWTRRSMYDKSYAEISRPDMPAILVEMFSHQNANDMARAMDPAFSFDMARAIYKGILRFLADRYGRNYTVQPLPPSALCAELIEGDSVRIRWKPTVDPLEPTAKPTVYRIYRRTGMDGAFDDGTETRLTEIQLALPRDGKVYSYQVTAVNEGGESFPSEIVSTGLAPDEQGRALVVNGFTRISPPALKKDGNGKLLGFDMDSDPGVPYINDLAIVGLQENFETLSPFEDNDRPGWGASSMDLFPNGLRGNSFDYPAKHGAALMAAGYSFASCSRDAFEQMPFRPSHYQLVDIIMGAQCGYPARYNIFNTQFNNQLQKIINGQVPVIISGSYIGSDPSASATVKDLLGYTYQKKIPNPYKQTDSLYYTPAFDCLQPANGGKAIVIEELPVAGVQHGKIFSFGFPLEILNQNILQDLFKLIDTLI